MKELGEIIGVAESTISQYETGKREPDFETLLKLGEYFDVSVDYLLRGENRWDTHPLESGGILPSIRNNKKSPESDASDSGALAERLYDFLISIGYLKPGQDLTDQQLDVLTSIVTILDVVFEEGKQ